MFDEKAGKGEVKVSLGGGRSGYNRSIACTSTHIKRNAYHIHLPTFTIPAS